MTLDVDVGVAVALSWLGELKPKKWLTAEDF